MTLPHLSGRPTPASQGPPALSSLAIYVHYLEPNQLEMQASGDGEGGAVGSGGGGEALSDGGAVAGGLKADRMNRTVSLPDCLCIQQPRVVSYAEVGDPNGFVVSQSSSQHEAERQVFRRMEIADMQPACTTV